MAVSGANPALGSKWGQLSEHLKASFFAVQKKEANSKITWVRDESQPEVVAALSDANIEIRQNWQSAFENVNPDQKYSSFSALLQAGGFSSLLSLLEAKLGGNSTVNATVNEAAKRAKALEGRSNLTKLNSTQTFTGSPPIVITLTAHFRAYSDARGEVRDPVNQLISWALPKYIAPDGIVTRLLGDTDPALYPSKVPQIIGMRYADQTIMPLVIESIPYPLTAPRTSEGIMARASLTMTLASLSALDKNDWKAAFST